MNHVLIIGFVWPEPNSSAAGSRMLQLIHMFLKQGHKVTFASPATDSEHMINLEKIGVTKTSISVNSSSFDHFIKDLQPAIVMFDRFMMEEQFGWRVTKHAPNSIKILNTEDLHCLRKSRQESLKKNKTFKTEELFNNDITKREIASIYRCDLSLIISDFEMKLLEKVFGINKQLLHYLPFLLDPINSNTKNDWPSFEYRKHFITIGNFKHEPNWKSVLYLKETIWPLIKQKLPDTEMHIYGAYPPAKAIQLNNPQDGFYIKGRAHNAPEVMKNARVCLAPLQFGAGIKGKLAEAMLCGTPSITTTIGAEGMLHEDSDWNGFVTDDPITFAKAAVRLYSDHHLWSQSQQNGIEIINTRFQKESFESKYNERLKTIANTLEVHRKYNFIGNMLQYHTLRSTEYMSRWIEEKNK